MNYNATICVTYIYGSPEIKTLLQCMHNNMLETGVFSCKIKIELCLKIVSCDQGFKLFEKKIYRKGLKI